MPDTEDRLTIDPLRRLLIAKAAARHTWYTPSRLVRRTWFQSSSGIRMTGRSRVMPAEVTAASTGPTSRSVRLYQSRTCSGSATSHWVAVIRVPNSPACLASCSAASALER